VKRIDSDLHDDAVGDPDRLQAGRALPEEAEGRVGQAAGGFEVRQQPVRLKKGAVTSEKRKKKTRRLYNFWGV
jgi:hypothetical protein